MFTLYETFKIISKSHQLYFKFELIENTCYESINIFIKDHNDLCKSLQLNKLLFITILTKLQDEREPAIM